MDLDLGRHSIAKWAEGAPDKAGATDFTPAEQKFVVEMPIGQGGMGESLDFVGVLRGLLASATSR